MLAFATNSMILAPTPTDADGMARSRDYCLHDLTGRLLGTIAAPVRRPEVGPAAPTFYLRRIS